MNVILGEDNVTPLHFVARFKPADIHHHGKRMKEDKSQLRNVMRERTSSLVYDLNKTWIGFDI